MLRLSPSRSHFGATFGQLGAILGHRWAVLGPPWGFLGAILSHLVAAWGHLGLVRAILEPHGIHLWPSERHLGPGFRLTSMAHDS